MLLLHGYDVVCSVRTAVCMVLVAAVVDVLVPCCWCGVLSFFFAVLAPLLLLLLLLLLSPSAVVVVATCCVGVVFGVCLLQCFEGVVWWHNYMRGAPII